MHHSMHRGFMPSTISHGVTCNPCAPVTACGGVMDFGSSLCTPGYSTVDCRSAFSNLSNGAFLTGRGILDLTAAPFVLIGNLLSSNYGYEVFAYRKRHSFKHFVDPCHAVSPCCSVGVSGCMSGCDTCMGGFSQGIQHNVRQSHATVIPPAPRRSNSVIQASHIEPTSQVRFVDPR